MAKKIETVHTLLDRKLIFYKRERRSIANFILRLTAFSDVRQQKSET